MQNKKKKVELNSTGKNQSVFSEKLMDFENHRVSSDV